jgi:hypothetical protein
MKPFHVEVFLRLATILEDLRVKSVLPKSRLWGSVLRPGHPRERLSDDTRSRACELFAEFQRDCIELGLTLSAATTSKIQKLVAQPECEYARISPLAEELDGRLIDEMHTKLYIALSSEEAEYYVKPRDGWETIIARFPETVTDVEEARKCYALSRYSSAVFHSLQIIEAGLIELGTFLNVNDPKSGWTAVTQALQKVINKKHPDRSDFEKLNFDFLEQVQGTVEALKNAWRNKISHAQGRLLLMTKDFSPEIAEEILFASRAFMRRLADGLPS